LEYDIDVFQDLGENSRLKNYVGVGLWDLPSYFNHSCVDMNVSRFFLGDLMFLRANRHISKDEELIVTYVDAGCSYERRSYYLKITEDIDCQCRLCKLDLAETRETKFRRAQLLETFEKLIKPNVLKELTKPGTLKDLSLFKLLDETVSELRSLRKEHPELDFSSLEPMQFLAHACKLNGDVDRSISITGEAYKLTKTADWHQLHKYFIFDLAICYKKLKKHKESRKWFDLALKAFAEPVRGKFRDDEAGWRKEALYFMEKLSPRTISLARELRFI
jgi:hypothetical protein